MISPGGSSLSVRWPVSPLVVGAWWFPDLLAFFAARLALWALTVSLRLWATARAIEARVFAARPNAWQRPISLFGLEHAVDGFDEVAASICWTRLHMSAGIARDLRRGRARPGDRVLGSRVAVPGQRAQTGRSRDPRRRRRPRATGRLGARLRPNAPSNWHLAVLVRGAAIKPMVASPRTMALPRGTIGRMDRSD